MKQQLLFKSSLMIALFAVIGSASAGTQTSSLSVTATVVTNCTISSAPVAFGSYDTLAAANLTATGSVTIACTKNAAPNIALGLGLNPSGGRRMTDGANFLVYELFQQPGTTPGAACVYSGSPTVWGTTGANLFTPTIAPSKAARTYNVCGQVTSGQDVAAGSYADTVVATVNF